MIYAPVIIPTLSRFNLFQKCLESLENCTGANKTDVYIGLDFPPSEKYQKGWEKIDAYLHQKESSNKFHSLTVFRRSKNCGTANPNCNSALLRQYIETQSERYIFSEDDNVFSPNFLEFINKGLEKFKDDSSVFAINGFCHYPIYDFKYKDNNFFFHNTDYSAWGFGTWVEKRKKCIEDVRINHYFEKNFHWRTAYDIYKKHGTYRCEQYFAAAFNYGWIRMHDGVISIYLQAKNMNVVVPSISKVRNMGWNKQGQSFLNGISSKFQKQGDKHTQQPIDEESSFDYTGDPYSFYDDNNTIAAQNNINNKSVFHLIKAIISTIAKYYIKKIIHYKK